MNPDDLAEQIWPQLSAIAEARGLRRISRVEMVVGVLYGIEEEVLVESIQHIFRNTSFAQAQVHVRVLLPGSEFVPPNSDICINATGWEILILKLEGDEF